MVAFRRERFPLAAGARMAPEVKKRQISWPETCSWETGAGACARVAAAMPRLLHMCLC